MQLNIYSISPGVKFNYQCTHTELEVLELLWHTFSFLLFLLLLSTHPVSVNWGWAEWYWYYNALHNVPPHTMMSSNGPYRSWNSSLPPYLAKSSLEPLSLPWNSLPFLLLLLTFDKVYTAIIKLKKCVWNMSIYELLLNVSSNWLPV